MDPTDTTIKKKKVLVLFLCCWWFATLAVPAFQRVPAGAGGQILCLSSSVLSSRWGRPSLPGRGGLHYGQHHGEDVSNNKEQKQRKVLLVAWVSVCGVDWMSVSPPVPVFCVFVCGGKAEKGGASLSAHLTTKYRDLTGVFVPCTEHEVFGTSLYSVLVLL